MAGLTAMTLAGIAGLGSVTADYALNDGGVTKTIINAPEDIKDFFVPQMPDIPEIDPVAESSALATAQSEERSLINRAGLQTTKKVRSLLGREQTLGG